MSGRDAEEANLGRRVEAEAEQDSERIHLPAALDQTKEAPEQAPEQAAIGEHEVEVFLDEPAAALDGLERPPNRDEDDDIGDRDGEQEQRRHQRARNGAEALEGVETTLQLVAAMAIATVSATTIVEWPREKNRPTPTGRRPSCISLRVTLSIAAM